tara:strand:+ start:276 stop:938 length:663 start_codon:yes stop_codon:yes gene_type:complete
MDQKNYWTKQIIDWEVGSFGSKISRKKLPMLEQIASNFRQTIRIRRELALDHIMKIKPRSVLELGCASGDLALYLGSKDFIEKIYAFDIAPNAIENALIKVKEKKLENKVEFKQSSLRDISFDEFKNVDMILGLGLTPYLVKDEFENLIRYSSGKHYFIDFHMKGYTFQNLMHSIYRAIKSDSFPFYNRYEKQHLIKILNTLGLTVKDILVFKGVSFIKN